MLTRLRKLISGAGRSLWSHRWPVAGATLGVLALAGGIYLALAGNDDSSSSSGPSQPAPAPEVVVREVAAPERTEDLGFPAFATKNTTRIAGADAVANAAAASLAVFPSAGGVAGPDAVSLVDADEWQAGIAAASLVADPISAPVLITTDGEVGELTDAAIRELDPKGAAATAGREAFVIGAAAAPDGLETLEVEGQAPAGLAAEVDRLRERLAGKPEHIVVASADEPGYAMPAAAWAARSGDPVLFTERDSVPKVTIEALRRHDGVPVFVLGPTSAISAKALKEIERVAPSAERVGDEGEVENAIAFARYASGNFGWNINDPGHGLVLAGPDRPLDAAAAAPLSASGTWGPLLLSDEADSVPSALRSYLLDLKPGYADDPTRAVYNHVWLIGDTDALSVDLQAQVDELAEVAPVTSGSGSSSLGPVPGTPESQPEPNSNPSQ